MANLTPATINYSYLDKMITANTRKVADSWWRNLLNRYGIAIQYYRIDANTQGTHPLYGEVFEFQAPKPIRMMVDLPSEAFLFSKFGLHTDSDFVGVVHIGTWVNTFGHALSAEPKVGDVLRVDNTGWTEDEMDIHTNTLYASGDSICTILNKNITTTCQLAASANKWALDKTVGENANGESYISNLTLFVSPSDGDWRRFPQLYQITEKRYQDPSMNINFLNGHYVWILKGKRFEYSYETGAPQENGGAADNTAGGIVNDRDKIEEISDEVFDYNNNPESNDSVYGDY